MVIGDFFKFVFQVFDSEKSSGDVGVHGLERLIKSPYDQIRVANNHEPCRSILME
jgi:hypothetical protein